MGDILPHSYDNMSVLIVTILLSMRPGLGLNNSNTFEDERRCSNGSTCPTWFICNSQNSCQCGNRHTGMIACDKKKMTSAILDCYCVTYDKEMGLTFAGKCFYNCGNYPSKKLNDPNYHKLPKKPEMLLNKSVCNSFHRTGLLCGDCQDKHSPFVLSYNLSCVKCPDGNKNWWKFIVAAIVPLTFFYFFIVLFKINVTSSRLHGVVWFSQAISASVMIRPVMSGLTQGDPRLLKATKVALTFYSFWNLELFRSVIPDICLNVSTLQASALELVVALYPFVLIIASYTLIELYDRNVACIVTLWKPFNKILTIFRTSWEIRTSVIDSFSTFFLLSYMKTLSVTIDLLVPTLIYELGSNSTTFGVYHAPTVIYFGTDHLPYAIPAIVTFISLICFPMLILFLYPFQFFQKCISLFPLNWHYLHAFVDSFQGCFKDKTEHGMFDCRWFSALFLLARIGMFVLYATTMSMMYYVYGTIAMSLFLILATNIQPFKKAVVRYPSTDLIFMILLSILYMSLLGRDIQSRQYFSYVPIALIGLVTAFVPLVYISLLIGLWLVSHSRWNRILVNRLGCNR